MFEDRPKLLHTVPNAPITINNTVTPMFQIIIITATPWEFFSSLLVGGLSVVFEWKQVSSSF